MHANIQARQGNVSTKFIYAVDRRPRLSVFLSSYNVFGFPNCLELGTKLDCLLTGWRGLVWSRNMMYPSLALCRYKSFIDLKMLHAWYILQHANISVGKRFKGRKYAHSTFTMVSCNKREISSLLKELNRQRDKCSWALDQGCRQSGQQWTADDICRRICQWTW